MLNPNEDDKRVVVAVHACADEAEAAVVGALLRDRDIESFQNTRFPSSVYPMAAGGVTLYVDESSVEAAKRVIAEARSGA